jgi:hypothetical protein
MMAAEVKASGAKRDSTSEADQFVQHPVLNLISHRWQLMDKLAASAVQTSGLLLPTLGAWSGITDDALPGSSIGLRSGVSVLSEVVGDTYLRESGVTRVW